VVRAAHGAVEGKQERAARARRRTAIVLRAQTEAHEVQRHVAQRANGKEFCKVFAR